MRAFLKYIKFVLIFGEFHTGYLGFIHPLLFAPTSPLSVFFLLLFSFFVLLYFIYLYFRRYQLIAYILVF